jgi:MFS family permease
MMLATCLIDLVGRRRLIIVGFGGGSFTLILLSAMANAIQSSRNESDDTTSEGHRPALVLSLACSYSVCLCVCWLALDCLSAESFPTRIRGTGRGVCVATGRVAGFCVQFLYGPLVNDDRLGRMMGLASAFAFSGMVISSRTTDTTNIDLRDHWDYSSTTKAGAALSVDGTGASLDRLGEYS